MNVTLKITREPGRFAGFSNDEMKTVVNVAGVEFTDSLTANFLRAVADEIDPPQIAFPGSAS